MNLQQSFESKRNVTANLGDSIMNVLELIARGIRITPRKGATPTKPPLSVPEK